MTNFAVKKIKEVDSKLHSSGSFETLEKTLKICICQRIVFRKVRKNFLVSKI